MKSHIKEGRNWRRSLGEKQIVSAVEGRELQSWRRAREKGAQRGIHKEKTSPKSLAWKLRGANLCALL